MRGAKAGIRGIVLALALTASATADDAVRGTGFLTDQTEGQWLASRMLGTTVVGENNETFGDVSDVVIGRDGRAVALVIGVGGFLGLGEKTVAVPLDRIDRTPLLEGVAVAAKSTPRAPDKVVLRVTRAELQAAPEFRSAPRPLPSLPRVGASHP